MGNILGTEICGKSDEVADSEGVGNGRGIAGSLETHKLGCMKIAFFSVIRQERREGRDISGGEGERCIKEGRIEKMVEGEEGKEERGERGGEGEEGGRRRGRDVRCAGFICSFNTMM